MTAHSSESDLFEIVAVAVAEHDRAGGADLNVVQPVVIKYLSCNFLTGHTGGIFGFVEFGIPDSQRDADNERHDAEDEDQHTDNCDRDFKFHNINPF